VTFATTGDAYDRYMGRYSVRLGPSLVDFADIAPGARVLDVGCGPGALTRVLADMVGGENVAAIEPSEQLAAVCAERVPGADVRLGGAESLPWPRGTFDAALSQLVVNFMSDAPAGVAEMRRVVRPGGTVASCTWDYRHGMKMLRTFFDAALALDPGAPDEGRSMRYQDAEELRSLWEDAGLEEVETGPLTVEARYDDFEDFWEPFTLGVGPGGQYCASLEPHARDALRDECRRRLGDPSGPFTLDARAWAVKGRVPEE
jgi:ubiquinone/menaquinone biosynthesis C-methylase UbiE